MQRLNRDMLERYDIPPRPPEAVNAVQFGMDATLLGCVDRLLDTASPRLGIACVCAGADARQLSAQDGLYTLFTRGYAGEEAVRREEVVQSIVQVVEPKAAPDALAAQPSLRFAILNADAPDAPAMLEALARLLAARRRVGLGGLKVLCLSEFEDRASTVHTALCEVDGSEAFARWLEAECAFCPALADRLTARAEREEAARLCREMNYLDSLVHIAEPFTRLTIAGAEDLFKGEGIVHVPDIAPALKLRHFAWDGVLSVLAAPGWLLGCDTLRDTMVNQRLRDYIGNVITRELLPRIDLPRERASEALIETFARLENPMNDNRLLPCAHHLLARFERGALPALRRWAAEEFDVPPGLSHALAATIMLYAGARPAADGQGFEVARGKRAEAIVDEMPRLRIFGTLSHDMPPESLAYAALADRELWGSDLREIDGLEERVALALSAMQRDPAWLPEYEEA